VKDHTEKKGISVIIPVRNGEATMMACLNSLVSQSLHPDEIIIVDNGSADQTVFLVKQWALVHSDCHPRIVTEMKRGPSAARNRGAKVAKGEILVFLDADCVVASDWIERISEAMDEGSGAVGGPYQGSLPAVEKYAAMSWFFKGEQPFSFSSPFISRFLLGGNMALWRRDLEKVNGFDETLHVGEDLDLSFRLKKAEVPLKYIPHLAVTHQTTSSTLKRVHRAFLHGMLQSKIAKRDFRRRLILSTFEKSWQLPFPCVIAIEGVSLTKVLGAMILLGCFYPPQALGLFLILALVWEFRMVYRLLRLRVPVTFSDCVLIPSGWASARLAMEVGRLAGSLRYGLLCW